MKNFLLLSCASLLLAGCQHGKFPFDISSNINSDPSIETEWASDGFDYEDTIQNGLRLRAKISQSIPKDKINTSTRALAAEGIVALEEGELEEASHLFNTALRLELNNSSLQFMNALTYHLMAKGGNAQNFALAEQGYELAYKFDNTNVLAKYYLGLAYLDQRKFDAAQATLAAAAVMDEYDSEILYDLARASYFSGDPRTAKAALDKLLKLNLDGDSKTKMLRALILTNAALNMTSETEKLLAKFERDPKTHKFLSQRVSAWKRYHQEAKDGLLHKASLSSVAGSKKNYMSDNNVIQMAQALPKGPRIPGIPGAKVTTAQTQGSAATQGSDFVNSEMAVVDVVIVRTQEDVSSNKGMNLLSGLQLQFGDPLTNTSGFSWGRNKIDDMTSTNSDTNSTTLSRLISIPAVNYSLNIFNTLDGRNEILARPSLVALANERSEFFSGVDVVAAAVSGGDGSSISVNKKIGVKLSIVPEFLPDDRIKLEVQAERTFLTSPSSSVQFEFRLDTSMTNVTANVVMKFGETLILSGLSEKETESSRNAVPFLGDVPVIQYLFSKQAKRDFRKSVLIMLTPRRAQYVNQDPTERERIEQSLSEYEKSLSTFEMRNKNWFVPRSNISEVIETTKMNSLFHEFKTGDFALENWNSRDTHEKRLRSAVDFLFY